MLFRRDVLDAIRSGAVTLAFRRWRRPTVKPGGRLRTAAGELAIRVVEPVPLDAITASDARRAGFGSRAELLADIDRQPDGTLYRIGFRLTGADPRVALRAQSRLGAAEREAIAQRLDRMDRGTAGPWTRPVLALIRRRPAVRAAELAAERGESDLAAFKSRVRRLKELGLTESLEVGYRLSPRGAAFLGGRGRR